MDESKREELSSNGMPGKCDYQKNRACLDLVTLLLTSVFSRLGLESLVGLHRPIQLQLLQHQCLGHNLNYYDVNGLPWKRTEILL